jgi:hypothetical protein
MYQFIMGPYVISRNLPVFLRYAAFNSCPPPPVTKAGGLLPVGTLRLLIQYVRKYLPYFASCSFCPQPETVPAVVTGDTLNAIPE